MWGTGDGGVGIERGGARVMCVCVCALGRPGPRLRRLGRAGPRLRRLGRVTQMGRAGCVCACWLCVCDVCIVSPRHAP